MRISGKISHWDVPPRAAQRNETKGNIGAALGVPGSRTKSLFEPGAYAVGGNFFFCRGRYDDGVAIPSRISGIFTYTPSICTDGGQREARLIALYSECRILDG